MKKSTRIIKYSVYGFILISIVSTFVFVLIQMITSPSQIDPNKPYGKVKTDYTFMLIMSFLGFLGTLVPLFCDKKLKIVLPTGLEITFLLFLYGSVYLGEVRSFYYKVPIWDDILHAMSGAMFAIMAFSVVNFLNKKHFVDLNPLFISIFAFCFAVTLGVVWEIVEFVADGTGGFNMQKWANETGEALIGRVAVVDTMVDLIIDSIGAFTFSAIGYLSLKGKKEIINSFLIVSKKDAEEKKEEHIQSETNEENKAEE